MTTTGRDWKFKNRVKKLLADKIVGDSNIYSKNRKKLFCNYGKTSVGVLRIEDTNFTDDEISDLTISNNHDNSVTGHVTRFKSQKKGTKEINSNKDLKQSHDDDIEPMPKAQSMKKKRRRIGEAIQSSPIYSVSKKQKTNLKKKRTDTVPQSPSNLINGIKSDVSSTKNTLMTPSEQKMQFGIPTIIRGTPENCLKFPSYNSPVSNLTTTTISSNLRGDILKEFFSYDENPHLAVFENVAMINNRTTIGDDVETDETDVIDENDTELLNRSVENPEYDSDVSFISSNDESCQNFSPNQTDDDIVPKLVLGDSLNSESNTKEKPEFYSLQNKVIAIMSPCCKFYFNGKLRVKVLLGKVEIYGFIFSESQTVVPAEIYSPRGSSLISFESVDHRSDYRNDIYSLLTNEGIDKGIATDVQNKFNELPDGQTVLILENLENRLTKYLDFYYPLKVFPKIEDSANYHNRHPKKAEKLLQAIFQYDDLGKQLKKDDYQETYIIKKLLQNPNVDNQRVLIAGGKGVGKSTTLRFFVNRLLTIRKEIIVVDFDPGQSEFAPPGCISLNIIDQPLTGPNYTHLKTPFHQIFIGDVNVARCVPRYVKAAKKLVNYLNESPRLKGRTVIVNTMGFCDGIGWDLMVYIIKLIHPSTVVQISSERSKNNFRYLLSNNVINDQIPTCFTALDDDDSLWQVPCDHELHIVHSLAEDKGKAGDFWEMEPRQLRDITLLAYLSQIPNEYEDEDKFLSSALPRINETIPYSVPMSKMTISLTKMIVPASCILATINGNIVALCGVDETDETPDSHMANEFYPKTLLRAPLSTCYGFGIVRGVDTKKGNIFINTPLSINDLEHVNCLIGTIPLPMSLISSNNRNTPYIGEGVDLPTSRVTRRGSFRTRHRSNNNG